MSFKIRLEAFLSDARQRYGVRIATGKEFRSAESAQLWHIAHMIRYNSFSDLCPEHSEYKDGHAVISWEYLSNAGTQWHHVRRDDFLRDANNRASVQQEGQWVPGREPDRQMTQQRALEVLRQAAVSTAEDRPDEPHSAMVLPGYDGCGGPCSCGDAASKHVSGNARDLKRRDLGRLEKQLQRAGAGTIDDYLGRFGLCRPIASEPWHVEAIDDLGR